MLIAIGVRAYELDAESLWLDEAFSFDAAARPLSEIRTADRGHPPLYHYALHAWMRLGDDERTLRALSLIFSVATVPFVYALGRMWGGGGVGLLAALVFALASFQVRYAQEVRMYALLALEASIALWALARILRASSRARAAPRARARLQAENAGAGVRSGERAGVAWLAYVVATAAMLWTQHTSVMFVVAANVCAVALLALGEIADAHRFALRWLAAHAIVLAAWLPAAPLFARSFENVADGFWIPPVTLSRTVLIARSVFGVSFIDHYRVATLAIGLLALVGLWKWRADRVRVVVCVAAIAVPFAIEVASGLVSAILLDRSLIWTTIPFYVLVAAGALGLRPRALAVACAAGVVVVYAASLHASYDAVRKEEWKEASAFVGAHARDGDLLIFVSGGVQSPFDYYFRRWDVDVDRYAADGFPLSEPSFHEAARRATAAPRTWLVRSHSVYQDPHDRVLAMLRSRCTQTHHLAVHLVDVYGFERCG